MSTKIVVVANRLPVRRQDGVWQQSPGGLVTALTPILQATGGAWVGWAGIADEDVEPFSHAGVDQIPVTLSRAELDEYYLGFCNETLWPLLHDAIRASDFHRSWWRAFRRVNERFAEAVIDVLEPGSLVWVQDYHLALLPELIKARRPDTKVRFFLHTPFPPAEIYARLPWRRQILNGLLAAGSIGFQTERSAANFRRAAVEYAGAEEIPEGLIHDGSVTRVIVAPISIDVAAIEEAARTPQVEQQVDRLREELGNPRYIMLGVDRLDYTKGIDVRLRAFETLLEQTPELAEETTFIQISVPSRQSIDDYADMREQIELAVGRINGAYGGLHHMPVHYIYKSLPREDLVAYYRLADLMLVTPLADGMNLVAKEYVASRVDGDGVLLLSEFAGAAKELLSAVLVNPFDIDGVARAMGSALQMEPAERRRRMAPMRETVRTNDVHAWARRAIDTAHMLTAV